MASGWAEVRLVPQLKAHLALEIRTGRERYAPEQRFLTPEGLPGDRRLRAASPVGRADRPPLLGFRLDGSDAARRAFANVRMVAFRPRQGPSNRGRSTAASPWRPAAGRSGARSDQ